MRVAGEEKLVEHIISELRNSFTTYNRSSNKEAVLYSLSQLFWFYFQINNYQQCTFLLKSAPQLPNMIETSKKAYKVTFCYYLGRMQLFDSKFKEAEVNLEKAFSQCHSNFQKHKIQILRLLIPTKLICGKLPSMNLIKDYKMYEYIDIIQAIKTGNLKIFNENMQRFQRLWIKRGLYFVMDKLQQILLRNLFSLIYRLNDKKTIVDVEMFMKGMNFTADKDQEYDIMETECIVGNLIYNGMIRGYVFPEEKKVVFSKDNAFPPLAGVFG